jgi:hypothetical protein
LDIVTGSSAQAPLTIPFVQLFAHSNLDSVGIAGIMAQDDLWQAHMPPSMRARLSRPVLCYKYGKPAALSFCNVSAIARMSEKEMGELLSKPCACTKPTFMRYLKSGEDHIITTDTSLLRSASLQSVMAKGSKFRSDHVLNEDEEEIDPVVDIERAASTWLSKVRSSLGKEASVAVKPWLDTVTGLMAERMAARYSLLGASNSKPLLSKTDLHRLHALQRVFAFTTIDKAGNNFCIVCKKHYVELCLAELKQGSAYSPTSACENEIHLDAKSALARHGLKANLNAKLPHFMGTFKFHKIPVGVRFMAGSAQSAVKDLSVWLSRGLKAMMDDVNGLWNDISALIPDFTPHGSWIISDSTAVPELVQKVRGSWGRGARIATYDFSTMYTTLPHSDMKQRLRALVIRVFARRLQSSRARFLLVREDGHYEWVNSRRTVEPGREFLFSAETLACMIDTLVERMFVQFGGVVYRQKVGVPMGTNCAGFLANLYCFTYELNFMERLVKTGQFDMARSFQRCQRYIDDLLCLDVKKFEEFMYYNEEKGCGLYPSQFLSLSLADSGSRVPYMDIALRSSRSRGLYTAIYDKRLDSKYAAINVIRYPDISSVLSAQAKYGIVTSQLHRFAKRCTRVDDFAYNAALVLYRMEQKGYRDSCYWKYVRKFFRDQHTLYGGGRSIGCWVRLIRKPLRNLMGGSISPGPFGPEN